MQPRNGHERKHRKRACKHHVLLNKPGAQEAQTMMAETFLSVIGIGKGMWSPESLILRWMVSSDEQYCRFCSAMPSGRQSDESSRSTSLPDLVICLPLHVNASMPAPVKSTTPEPSAKDLSEMVTSSLARPGMPT